MSESLVRAIVLTAAPGSATLDEARLAPVRALADDAALLQEDVLAEGDAWQALIVADETIPLAAIEAPYAAALTGAQVDLNVIPDDISLRRSTCWSPTWRAPSCPAELRLSPDARSSAAAGAGERKRSLAGQSTADDRD